jgi:hypothetical protein
MDPHGIGERAQHRGLADASLTFDKQKAPRALLRKRPS